jgi:hypothetical protein
MTNKIYFDYYDIGLSDIKPSKEYIPKWYKNIKSYNKSNIEFDDSLMAKKNVKNCMPFLDTLTSGYMVELWTDIYCKKIQDGHDLIWQEGPTPVDYRGKELSGMPVPEGHSNHHYIWKLPYSFKLPKGYSALITHPLNRFDLPFTTSSGIVDMDFGMGGGNIPFFIKDNFNGIIEKGTPIFQIIPIKRKSWIAKRKNNLVNETSKLLTITRRSFYGWYKDNIWIKKEYN